MNERPTIYVTGPDRGAWPAWLFTARAIRRAGGRPVRVRPGAPRPSRPMDGLVVGGGTDVSPNLYEGLELTERPKEHHSLRDRAFGWLVAGARLLFGVNQPARDPARDDMETALLQDALQKGVPVLGICRGMQMLNVTRGGNLVQDVATFYGEHPHVRSIFPRRDIEILPDSRLFDALGTSSCLVNALHDQAVQRLGAGLAVAARDERGVVQAIEDPSRLFVMGVQWHPEYLPQLARQRRLFRRFVAAAHPAAVPALAAANR